jgi:hypothetical protein
MKGLIVLEQQVKELGMMVQTLTAMVEDYGRQIADIYKELDMVDGDLPMDSYDFCDCDKHYGHICGYTDRI